MRKSRFLAILVLMMGLLAATACSSATEETTTASESTEVTQAETPAEEAPAEEAPAEEALAEEAPTSFEVTDARGKVEVPATAKSVVATDNRIFRILDAWGVELSGAPIGLMPREGVSYTSAENINDLGIHREPNLEMLVASQPDLVLNGQRFSSHYDEIKKLVPDAAVVDTNIDFENAKFADEYVRQLQLLGEVLGRQDDAQVMIDDFNTALERAKAAYNPDHKVMGVITSGGDIGYSAPGNGRAIGPLFPAIGMTPALEQDGTSDHQGDDVSVEAIASSNPDFIIVLDRDASFGREDFTSATELLNNSEALQNVPAVANGNIYVLPNNFYLAEDIINYTKVLNDLADMWEANN